MIRISNLSFAYGKSEFISDLCLTLPDSSLTAIVGENGSGKTTLLSLMSKELSSTSGSIEVDGVDIRSLKRRDLARRLSVFPQGREIPDMTALELVTMGRYPYIGEKLTTPQADTMIARAALLRAGAEDFTNKRLPSLSFGERQRIYLAMQIAQDTQNLLLDEPTNHLDISARFQTMDLLRELTSEGKCVAVVLHDLTLALSYADRIALMKNGALLAYDTPDKIYQSKALEEVFGIKITKFSDCGRTIYVTEANQSYKSTK